MSSIGGRGKRFERQLFHRHELQLPFRPADVVFEVFVEGAGRVAEFADVQDVDVGIGFRRPRNGRAAQHDDFAGDMRAVRDVDDLLALDVHPAGEDDVGPGHVGTAGGLDVFINEANVPILGHRGGDDQ